MIDLHALRRMAASFPVVVVDHAGRRMDRDGLPDELPVPGLLVSLVAEAVKEVGAGRVIVDLDRETMWAVGGFVLDVRVLDALGDGTYSVDELIRAVTSAGFDWQPTPL